MTARCSALIACVCIAALSLVVLGGCTTSGRRSSPYTVQPEEARDPREADRLNGEAVKLMDEDPIEAESLLRRALTADLYHGPAHNNLGVLYLGQGLLYEAANEFEWARKLMPGHPDPRLNLALTLERAGRADEALTTYAAALEVYPDYIPAIQAMVRLQVRSGNLDDHTPGHLREIALRGENESWRQWARAQLLELEPGAPR